MVQANRNERLSGHHSGNRWPLNFMPCTQTSMPVYPSSPILIGIDGWPRNRYSVPDSRSQASRQLACVGRESDLLQVGFSNQLRDAATPASQKWNASSQAFDHSVRQIIFERGDNGYSAAIFRQISERRIPPVVR
jgi:hypothetical protein